MGELTGKVALVTGASRGVGKGVALALAQQGAVVYFTGRTLNEGEASVDLPGSLMRTQQDIEALGGTGFFHQCDHTDDDQTRAVIQRIEQEQGRLDILVNNAWGGYEHYWDGTRFWEEQGFWTAPLSRWDRMFDAGVRVQYVTTSLAIPLMLKTQAGLIANISFIASHKVDMGVAYGAAKAASDHMTRCMAHELKPHGLSVVALHPGLVRTESVIKSNFFDLSNSHSPEYVGMAVSALYRNPEKLNFSGKSLDVLQIALDHGYADIDGRQPLPGA
ncbi:SDR family NAD(P)-dependent oxidoreductase [Deinococcus cellulosilyticus]|uniref:Oxidoreductase n=1 Tax=Deinococcus cellulosilyticus (strain DSM 18568 / NBRC 106333 / KACC 11606 / 5516J-15) TaxID=1223518 RepID=A0A511N0V5_DEIC1|nr:SDR family NAD(P)-dependent oxidoreductase [Deinococcus cellulosilyticus]GEM46484.1 oxidoreductase [Deinococcus cellulosilyticus NBRC 106333 = KACC 11606]